MSSGVLRASPIEIQKINFLSSKKTPLKIYLFLLRKIQRSIFEMPNCEQVLQIELAMNDIGLRHSNRTDLYEAYILAVVKWLRV